jgi:hypothetical protein
MRNNKFNLNHSFPACPPDKSLQRPRLYTIKFPSPKNKPQNPQPLLSLKKPDASRRRPSFPLKIQGVSPLKDWRKFLEEKKLRERQKSVELGDRMSSIILRIMQRSYEGTPDFSGLEGRGIRKIKRNKINKSKL